MKLDTIGKKGEYEEINSCEELMLKYIMILYWQERNEKLSKEILE